MSVNMIRGINMILTGDTIKKRYLNPTAENIVNTNYILITVNDSRMTYEIKNVSMYSVSYTLWRCKINIA